VADRRLRIDRLVIRVRGVREPEARRLGAALAPAILHQLGTVLDGPRPSSGHVDAIDAGTVTLAGRDRTATAIADRVAAGLRETGER